MSNEREELLNLVNGYQPACILAAACELNLFSSLRHSEQAPTSDELAKEHKYDQRGLDVLLSALVSMGILSKQKNRFFLLDKYKPFLDAESSETIIPMILHSANCLRNWSQLAWAVKFGRLMSNFSSINGPLVDNQSFIQGMNVIGKPIAEMIVQRMKDANLLSFKHLLDLGGASGTYTLAFLKANPKATATIFDLPMAIHEASKSIVTSPFKSQIHLHEGNFYEDQFPEDFDFVWISAIIHQQNEEQTEQMFKKSWNALQSGGRIAIRDIYINSERTESRQATFFGVNMLVNTLNGRVYTCEEVFRLLEKAGFKNPRCALPAQDMSAVIIAEKE